MTKKAQFKFSERSKRHFEGRKSKKSANRKERHAKNQSADIYTLHSPPPSVETAYTTNKSVRPLEAKTSAQKNYINAIKNNCLTFGIGPAGTGKSYCAAAIAADALEAGRVERVILTRPAVEAGEQLGFLPGDVNEKFAVYIEAFRDTLNERLGSGAVDYYLRHGRIVAAPLAFMRGKTFSEDTFVILDEAQNTSVAQMKMFLTRMGKNAKFLLTGDPGQIDLPRRVISGLKEALLILKDIKGVGMVFLDDKDVIRHKLVKKVIEAYKNIENRE